MKGTSHPDLTDALILQTSATETLRGMVDMTHFIDRKPNLERVFMCAGIYILARKSKKPEARNTQCRTPIRI